MSQNETNRSSTFRHYVPPPGPKRLRPFGPLDSNVIDVKAIRQKFSTSSNTLPRSDVLGGKPAKGAGSESGGQVPESGNRYLRVILLADGERR